MTTSEIGDIVYAHCKRLSVADVRRGWNVGRGEAASERVCVTVKPATLSGRWCRAFVEVNVCVPDIQGEADLVRLADLEREYSAAFGLNTGVHRGARYRFRREGAGLMDDAAMRLHYVNIRVLFEFINVIEQWQEN